MNRFANIHKITADTTKYMKQVWNNVRIKRSFKICFCQTKTYRVLSMGKRQLMQWGGHAKFGNEEHISECLLKLSLIPDMERMDQISISETL